MGGSFDPVHNGHLKVARAAARLGLDLVVLAPARQPPHKNRPDMAHPFHRFAMTALATADDANLCVSPIELYREGPSYTIDTVRHFRRAGHDVVLIMGSDSLAELETWRDCHDLLELASIMVYPREPFVGELLEEKLPGWIRAKRDAGVIVEVGREHDATSSTSVRELLRAEGSATGLIPAAVERYIIKHRIYAGGLEGPAD